MSPKLSCPLVFPHAGRGPTGRRRVRERPAPAPRRPARDIPRGALAAAARHRLGSPGRGGGQPEGRLDHTREALAGRGDPGDGDLPAAPLHSATPGSRLRLGRGAAAQPAGRGRQGRRPLTGLRPRRGQGAGPPLSAAAGAKPPGQRSCPRPCTAARYFPALLALLARGSAQHLAAALLPSRARAAGRSAGGPSPPALPAARPLLPGPPPFHFCGN